MAMMQKPCFLENEIYPVIHVWYIPHETRFQSKMVLWRPYHNGGVSRGYQIMVRGTVGVREVVLFL
jgi:hypothetical protein